MTHWVFPNFDPVLIQLGPIGIRWYALAYIGSLVLGWQIVRRLVRLPPVVATVEDTDDFLTWATLGVVLGGRIGYVLIYGIPFQPEIYVDQPWHIFAVWQGGMSFHGGAAGVVVALVLFCRKRGIPLLGFADRIAIVTPMGLGFGRIANFINGELWGRVAIADVPWTMAFPGARDGLYRHPSQLYQALMEGLILLIVTASLGAMPAVRARFGVITGVFLVGYAIARAIGEQFREPDAPLGYLFGGLTMGQLLSVPMVVAGLWLIIRARPRPLTAAVAAQ